MTLYPSIRIEGGLLGPDVLDQLLSAELPGQRSADFGLDVKRNLTDEIAATFADARALWGVFQRRLERLPDDDLATSVTRDAWAIPFLGLLGYEPRFNQRAYDVDGITFAISHRAGEATETPPVHIVGARQELGRVPASGRPRLAPHSLVQEYLNRTENLWGVVTNGRTIRMLRDCTFVRRQAYIEFDLPGILDEQRFQDFAALYRLLHRTRLPKGFDDSADCLLEKYYAHSVEQGGRVREHLREGVEECLKLLANGFLAHRANDELRRRASPGCSGPERISGDAFYRQLLILVYRFLFLLVSEDRGLLSTDLIYRQHYSVARLRRLLDHRAAFTDHDDLWQSLRVLWLVLIKEQPQPALNNQTMAASLGLAVLNGDLFAPQDLDNFTISNRDLLNAFWRLAWYQESRTSPPRRVNYAALDVEELGSVYESLLELHPFIEPNYSGQPVFDFSKGGGRKETGSYYTPPELVGELVKSALEPVIEDRLQQCKNAKAREAALLSIRVCDPACGSGHFLLAAARRMGKELARIRTGEDEPAPERVRESVRDVISHCIYGVDRNQLAVDLCRVALWLEGHTTDKPLTFLDHRIRWGDSLVGVFDLEVLEDGIPDDAFSPLEGDDKETAKELTRQNREERRGARDLFGERREQEVAELQRHSREVDAITDDSPELIRRKKQLFEESHRDPAWRRRKELCDMWTAAFFQPLKPDTPAITTAALSQHATGRPIDPRFLGRAGALSVQQRFFHWPLEFPEVFADGGFDALLSNPPWEHVELKEQEFFATRDARISAARTKSARAKMIRGLEDTDPELFREYMHSLRSINATRAFLANSDRYPLTGRGRINTYAVFAELASTAINGHGRTGVILPKGIATDDTTKHFFGSIVSSGRLVDLIGFENEEFIFPAIDHRVTFCKMTMAGVHSGEHQSRIGFYVRRYSQLSEEERFFTLDKSEFWLLNPNTGNCPIFRTQADAELTKAIYRRVPILWREATDDQPEINPWRLRFMQGLFNLSSDSHYFRSAEEMTADGYRLESNIFISPYDRYLPLYEAKMLHQFDHRFSTYEGATEKQLNVGILPQPTAEQKGDPAFVVQPRYWVREEVVDSAIPRYPEPLAMAVQIDDRKSIQRVLLWWCAGFHLSMGDEEDATRLLMQANQYDLDKAVTKSLPLNAPLATCRELQDLFPLTAADVSAVEAQISKPESIARELTNRFSPKWLIGWRDITNAGNERTLLVSALPVVGVGNSYPLFFMEGIPGELRLVFQAIANAYVVDYVARQKVGGTHINYFYLKQFPFLRPSDLRNSPGFDNATTLQEWLKTRVIELSYTSCDLASLGQECDAENQPFCWHDARRFEIRCELDAAMFYVYLPTEDNGRWKPADAETEGHLAVLTKHFPTPRDAVGFILDQFPITRDKDEKAHGHYRTKDRILEIYDRMLEAQRSGLAYQTTLDPPPGIKGT